MYHKKKVWANYTKIRGREEGSVDLCKTIFKRKERLKKKNNKKNKKRTHHKMAVFEIRYT